MSIEEKFRGFRKTDQTNDYQPQWVTRKVANITENFNFEAGVVIYTFNGYMSPPLPVSTLPLENQKIFYEVRDHFFPELGGDKAKFTPS